MVQIWCKLHLYLHHFGAIHGANTVQFAPLFAPVWCNSWCKHGANCTSICTILVHIMVQKRMQVPFGWKKPGLFSKKKKTQVFASLMYLPSRTSTMDQIRKDLQMADDDQMTQTRTGCRLPELEYQWERQWMVNHDQEIFVFGLALGLWAALPLTQFVCGSLPKVCVTYSLCAHKHSFDVAIRMRCFQGQWANFRESRKEEACIGCWTSFQEACWGFEEACWAAEKACCPHGGFWERWGPAGHHGLGHASGKVADCFCTLSKWILPDSLCYLHKWQWTPHLFSQGQDTKSVSLCLCLTPFRLGVLLTMLSILTGRKIGVPYWQNHQAQMGQGVWEDARAHQNSVWGGVLLSSSAYQKTKLLSQEPKQLGQH